MWQFSAWQISVVETEARCYLVSTGWVELPYAENALVRLSNTGVEKRAQKPSCNEANKPQGVEQLNYGDILKNILGIEREDRNRFQPVLGKIGSESWE